LKTINIYQTLKDQDYLSVEENGPFPCKWENTWLGEGFYFWEEFIEIAHWWGENRRGGEYIICQAECDFDHNCLDLVGNMKDIRMFRDALSEFKNRGLADDKTTVARIITFMKNVVGNFNYLAIRAYGINSISPDNLIGRNYVDRLIFEEGKKQYLDILPPVQICIYSKKALNLRNYRIVYPEHYCEDYVF
jgi:hypothetical protein